MGEPEELPVLALRNAVLFPGGSLPVAIGGPKSMQAARAAVEGGLFVVAYRSLDVVDPKPRDLFATGTVAKIHDADWSEDSARLVLHGVRRASVTDWCATEPFLRAWVTTQQEQVSDLTLHEEWLSALRTATRQLVAVDWRIPAQAVALLEQCAHPIHLADMLAANVLGSVAERQIILESEPKARVERLLRHLSRLKAEAEARPRTVSDWLARVQRWWAL